MKTLFNDLPGKHPDEMMALPSSTAVFHTLRDVLRFGCSHLRRHHVFFGHGSTNVYDEVAFLLLHTLNLPLEQLEPFLDARLLQDEIQACMHVIDQRARLRIPAAYLTNEAWLAGYRFFVDERVIVPRSYLAELLPAHFAPWISDPDTVTDVLELCTGSGCLAIMAADLFQNATVDAVDLSADALQVATRNVTDYQLQDRIALIQSDVFAALPERKYDLIISNPPYVNSQSMTQLPGEYRHEPVMALEGGTDGMDIVRKILAGARQRLKPHGVLVIEIGNERAFAEAAFPDMEMTWLTTSAGDDSVFLITAEQLQG